MTAEYPAHMEVEGAIRLSSEDTRNVSTWQWRVVVPTPWRLHEGYSQVTFWHEISEFFCR